MTCKWKSLILLVTFNGHPVETIENVTISIFILVSFEKSLPDKVMSGTNCHTISKKQQHSSGLKLKDVQK